LLGSAAGAELARVLWAAQNQRCSGLWVDTIIKDAKETTAQSRAAGRVKGSAARAIFRDEARVGPDSRRSAPST